MRVLVVLTYYYPHWTGLTAYARRLAEGLAARGHQVTVLTSRYREDLAAEEVVNGVRVVRLWRLLRISRGVVMPTFPLVARRLIAAADVVQMHTPLMESPIVARLARWAGKPSVFTHHGDLVMPSRPFDQFVEWVVTSLMTQALKDTTRAVIASQDYADHSSFLAPFRDKLACIYPPVEIPRPVPEQAVAWRRELGLEQAKLVGFAGRFVEEKGFDYLLKAIPHLLERVPNAHLIYAGDPHPVYESFFEKWSHLIEQWRDRITLLGLIQDPQKMANWYAMCDALALSSRTDSFGIVQVEAMLCGTPVVATDIPGARVVVQATGMGRLVTPQNERALAEGLAEVFTQRERFVKPRSVIEAAFDPNRTIDQYEQLFQSLIGRSSAS